MIDAQFVATMACYNRWQNDNLYGVAGSLDDAARRADRGAFFGSIHATLNHILWADGIWMSRFTGASAPAGSIGESTRLHDDWRALRDARSAFDATIEAWAGSIDPGWLRSDVVWHSGAQGRELRRPAALLVTHFFNHQTHHRGQAHAMLTAAGAEPSMTDLAFMDTPLATPR